VLEHLFADVRFALRWLRRSPAFTLVAVVSLAIGIGFNTALFTLVDALLFRPLPVERPDRLVDVFTSGGDADQYATSSYPDFLDFRTQNQVFTGMLAYSPAFGAVTLAGRSRLAMGETVTGNYFQLLGVTPVVGRVLLPDDDRIGAPRVVVVSHRLWTREYAASPSAIGQTMRIHNQPYTIVGVAPASFTGMVPLLAPEVWTAIAYVDEIEPGGIISTVPSPTGSAAIVLLFTVSALANPLPGRRASIVDPSSALRSES
jgi:putative ABC transport system permease protein